MKDDVSVRVTFSEKGKESAFELMTFIENHFENISFQAPRRGNNPKYKPGGASYSPEQGEFSLSYSRCKVKKFKPLLPVKKLIPVRLCKTCESCTKRQKED